MRDTPVLVILLVVLLVLAFAATFFGMRMVAVWLPQQVCDILVYEVDQEFSGAPNSKTMSGLISAMNVRLNPGMVRRALVVDSGGGGIEVHVLGGDPQMAARIKRLLDSPGTLEFRILANKVDHEKIVHQAVQDNDSDDVRDEEDTLLAKWVPVRSEYNATDEYSPYGSETITRMKRQGNQQVTQALVVQDEWDIGTKHLESAAVRADYEGNPCIDFKLTPEGGGRLAELTGANLPNFMQQDNYRKLGIILDGRLCSSQVIHQTITSTEPITSGFSHEEAADLAASLDAGPLPAKIRYVKRREPQRNR